MLKQFTPFKEGGVIFLRLSKTTSTRTKVGRIDQTTYSGIDHEHNMSYLGYIILWAYSLGYKSNSQYIHCIFRVFPGSEWIFGGG